MFEPYLGVVNVINGHQHSSSVVDHNEGEEGDGEEERSMTDYLDDGGDLGRSVIRHRVSVTVGHLSVMGV